uniref:Secreted protein n=1 Tax=Prolemur simus TaxID=1328070 RepID=A0A8C9DKU7_PROSS
MAWFMGQPASWGRGLPRCLLSWGLPWADTPRGLSWAGASWCLPWPSTTWSLSRTTCTWRLPRATGRAWGLPTSWTAQCSRSLPCCRPLCVCAVTIKRR